MYSRITSHEIRVISTLTADGLWPIVRFFFVPFELVRSVVSS
jgi:hypothetical protein